MKLKNEKEKNSGENFLWELMKYVYEMCGRCGVYAYLDVGINEIR